MTPAAPKVPSVWRIVRTYLAEREYAKIDELLAQVHTHRPNISYQKFYQKMLDYKRRGTVKWIKNGHVALTQEGRQDYADPEEKDGLPKPKSVCPVTIPAETATKQKRGAGNHSPEHMRKMTEARLARGSANRAGQPTREITIAGKPVQVDEDLIAKLLKAQDEATKAARIGAQMGPDIVFGTGRQSNSTIDLPIGIRLKVTVEVV